MGAGLVEVGNAGLELFGASLSSWVLVWNYWVLVWSCWVLLWRANRWSVELPGAGLDPLDAALVMLDGDV